MPSFPEAPQPIEEQMCAFKVPKTFRANPDSLSPANCRGLKTLAGLTEWRRHAAPSAAASLVPDVRAATAEPLRAQTLLIIMTEAFYRREANRYRLLAADADRQQAEQFRRMAAECEDLADDLDRDGEPWRSIDIASSKGRYLAWPLARGGSR